MAIAKKHVADILGALDANHPGLSCQEIASRLHYSKACTGDRLRQMEKEGELDVTPSKCLGRHKGTTPKLYRLDTTNWDAEVWVSDDE